jgi:hypothetical protein
VASLARKIADVSRLQLVFLSLTWLAGIYVNGFVLIIPGMNTETILLNPAVESHVVLATLSAATSVFILALAWAGGQRRLTVLALLASISIVLAGDSGIAFVLGGGSDSAESMIMAAAFITAIFLTFLSMASLKAGDVPSPGGGGRAGGRVMSRAPLLSCYAALLLFYAVFLTGIYVNLFVAGPVFSLPLGLELAAFRQAESMPPFVLHEVIGGALLVTLVVLTISLWSGGARRASLMSAAPALFVAYSAYVGLLDLTSSPVPAVSSSGMASVLVPLLSSAGLMAATVITMLLTLKIRANRSLR